MNVQQAYNIWADQYDTNQNKTRDLEGVALIEILSTVKFENCLEIGCGTGKNTEWLITQANSVTSVDLSEEMLAKAKVKITSDKVVFKQADITQPWSFANKSYDLVGFSLVLEHIENLEEIFKKIAEVTHVGSYIYVGELHPFKQYAGTKARFETEEGLQIVTCFNHNLSDFTQAAKRSGFEIVNVNEYFDDNDRTNIPRILTLLFKRF
jgi:ubiquinone/menaquinone biosynthesis C-methylase UbiE